MIPDPRTTRLIHDTMIQEELERHGSAHLRRTHEPFPVGNPLRGLRGLAASAILHLANRIDPMPRGACLAPECGDGAAA